MRSRKQQSKTSLEKSRGSAQPGHRYRTCPFDKEEKNWRDGRQQQLTPERLQTDLQVLNAKLSTVYAFTDTALNQKGIMNDEETEQYLAETRAAIGDHIATVQFDIQDIGGPRYTWSQEDQNQSAQYRQWVEDGTLSYPRNTPKAKVPDTPFEIKDAKARLEAQGWTCTPPHKMEPPTEIDTLMLPTLLQELSLQEAGEDKQRVEKMPPTTKGNALDMDIQETSHPWARDYKVERKQQGGNQRVVTAQPHREPYRGTWQGHDTNPNAATHEPSHRNSRTRTLTTRKPTLQQGEPRLEEVT
ncbi:hypothetical protein K504DRAFT_454244 [Pleomassaria siparia CBS 279.74]|uniref:Uncharacterized protein n=1 Tax=Pleomassaria siparia CBS 279.74 TaxID=1314801 RepID=A0A6G1JQE3_9PLEO|nr:hypothetical protein K504DRAFT_454244 [Pleomassaria siparia CBS 279.74]